MSNPTFIAFRGDKQVGKGSPAQVARQIFREGGDRRQGAVLAFDAITSQPLELDLRGSLQESLARLASATPGSAGMPGSSHGEREATRRGPGRPRLGVVAREVTLLPRHWDWLNRQPGGASAALRRLVESARGDSGAAASEARRAAQESAYRFMSAVLGNEPQFEAATRALFAGDAKAFRSASTRWPKDLRDHARRLASVVLSGE